MSMIFTHSDCYLVFLNFHTVLMFFFARRQNLYKPELIFMQTRFNFLPPKYDVISQFMSQLR